MIEVFAGTAKVTACLRQLGLVSSFGTDHIKSKHATAPVVLADLTTQAGIDLLMQWLGDEYVVGIFLAPPCGTASRARSIPLKRKSPGDPAAPRPLRSDVYPNGLPFLRFLDRIKVSKANKLYHLTAQLVVWATDVGCIFCIENPQFSFFWQTTFIQSIIHLCQFTIFQSCQYGSNRPKRTMLAFNAEEFKVINKLCEGVGPSHRHAKWGIDETSRKFATSLETSYPMPLAKLIAAQFVAALHRMGFQELPESLADVTERDNAILPALRAQAGTQSKAAKLPPMIPTFAAKVLLSGFVEDLPASNLLEKLSCSIHVNTVNAPTKLPKGSKLLSITPAVLPRDALTGGAIVSSQQISSEESKLFVEKFQSESADRSGETQSQLWGVPCEEDEFVKQMVKYGHPTSLHSCLPDVLKETVGIYNRYSAHERMAYRANRLGYWLRRLHELKDDELRFKRSMHADVAEVLRGKNVLLWRDMLQSNNYMDMDVCEEFSQGSDLVGAIPRTGLWPMRFQPACVNEADLADIAAKEPPNLAHQFENASMNEFSAEVWEKTMAEVKSGLLEGPLPLESVPASFPLSRRFGIQQGAKIRCIDDFSMSSVNASVQSCESPKPQTLDVFAAVCAYAMKMVPGSPGWVGRTFDLTGAYRQCAVKPSSYKYSHIMVLNPFTKKLVAFRMKALPFGAIRSVHSFLRTAHSLWFLLVRELWVLTTNYFDDYVTLATLDEAPSVKSCVHMFFKMLGWLFAEAGEKAPDFSCDFQALGVAVSVKAMHSGVVSLGNTETRRRELIELISTVLQTGRMTKICALKLRGRLQFASANIFGRVAKSALSMVTNHAYHSRGTKVDNSTILALRVHLHLLSQGRPRELRAAGDDCWFLQTDASFEPDKDHASSGVGAVLFNQTGRPVAFFSEKLEDSILAVLNPDGTKKTIIFECEFLALFAAFWKWNAMITGALVIYTDNNAVRDAMISCNTKNSVARSILVATLILESERCLWPWYSRVPTDSNFADAPSRFSISKLLQLGAVRYCLDVGKCWEHVEATSKIWGEQQAATISQLPK